MAKTKLKTLDSKTTVEKLEVTGFESVVPQIRNIDDQVTKLQEQRQLMKDLILNRVRDVKRDTEEKGVLYKSYLIKSEDDQPAIVQYKNMFSKLDLSNEEQLKKTLNSHYDLLFETQCDVKVKNNADIEKLRTLLGENFDVFFSSTKYIAFKKEFMENRAAVRDKLTKPSNAMLDRWVSENQASPDLRMKDGK